MPNNHKLRRFRKAAARKQRDRCHYCDAPMWSKNAWQFAERHGLTLEECAHFQCTAEHVVARRDGGGEVRNIVAACRYCNIARHQGAGSSEADAFRGRVRNDPEWLTALLLRRHSREDGNPEAPEVPIAAS